MNVKRIYYIIMCVAALTVTMMAGAITPRQALVTAPRDLFVAVDSLTRLDMLDYYEAGSQVGSRNLLGGQASVRHLDDERVTVATSGSSEVTIVTIPSRRDTVLLVISTLALPAPDSHAVMYSSDWQPLSAGAQLGDHNNLDLWLLPGASARRAEVENLVPFVPAIYDYRDGVLTVTQSLGRLLPADDWATVKPLLRPTLTYTWNGRSWSQIK